MKPEDFQKFQILSSDNEEYVHVVSSKLIAEAESLGHKMMSFTIDECQFPTIKYTKLQAFCVLCIYEIMIEYGRNDSGDFADVVISGEKCCEGKDI
jgi:hypothetical protein